MVEVIKLDHLGRGIGKLDGKIIFIHNALPNEIVSVKIIKDKKRYYEGIVTEYKKLSNKRIQPLCPYYDKCGGCDLMHLDYNDELKFKQEKIENIINQYVNENIKINKIIESDNIYNYRNKLTLHINNKIGLYQKQSNDIIEIDKCLIVDDKINKIINDLKKYKINTKEIVIKASNKETMISYNGNISKIEDLNCSNIWENSKLIKGNGYIQEKIGNLTFQISPEAFFQVNTKQTKKLYDKIKVMANLSKNDQVLDLYCGTGTIGLYLSDACSKVLGVEINEQAINNANNNKKINNIKNAEFIVGDAKKVIKDIKFKPSVIIVDPPRSGLFKGMVDDLIKFNANKIIYVSCDPMTLARDLNILQEHYEITEIQPVDLFPHTHHVECIAKLIRKMQRLLISTY